MARWGPCSAGAGLLLLAGAVTGGGVLGREAVLLGRLRARGRRTVATVVGHRRPTGWAGGSGRPVVRFVDVGGREVEFVPWRGPRGGFVPVGQQFYVVYLPEQPQRARLAAEARRRTLIGFVVADLVVLGLGVRLVT